MLENGEKNFNNPPKDSDTYINDFTSDEQIQNRVLQDALQTVAAEIPNANTGSGSVNNFTPPVPTFFAFSTDATEEMTPVGFVKTVSQSDVGIEERLDSTVAVSGKADMLTDAGGSESDFLNAQEWIAKVSKVNASVPVNVENVRENNEVNSDNRIHNVMKAGIPGTPESVSRDIEPLSAQEMLARLKMSAHLAAVNTSSVSVNPPVSVSSPVNVSSPVSVNSPVNVSSPEMFVENRTCETEPHQLPLHLMVRPKPATIPKPVPPRLTSREARSIFEIIASMTQLRSLLIALREVNRQRGAYSSLTKLILVKDENIESLKNIYEQFVGVMPQIRTQNSWRIQNFCRAVKAGVLEQTAIIDKLYNLITVMGDCQISDDLDKVMRSEICSLNDLNMFC